MSFESTPLIVGAGQVGGARFAPARPLAPVEIAALAAERALADAAAGAGAAGGECLRRLRERIDTVAFVRLFSDSAPRLKSPFGGSAKPPLSVAARLQLAPARAIYSTVGGNVPQKLVNELGAAIARGESRAALIVGAEALRTTADALRTGLTLDWNEEPAGTMEDRGCGEPLASRHELAHGIGIPVQTYPLFEHAIRGRRGASVAQHLAAMGRLMAPFTRVAAANPCAALPIERSAAELTRIGPENRWIGHPYPKRLNAYDKVDQGAAVLMLSSALAAELGIDRVRGVHLHGYADVNEKLRVLERADYASAPAVRAGALAALEMAGASLDAVELIDLYSCFPAAVEVGSEALGLAEDDPRGLTLTGGLPFFGGPGNNYSLHAICEAVTRLRVRPHALAMVWANGGYLSKHAFGIYGVRPPARPWRDPPHDLQARIDALASPAVVESPAGCARIETYTVMHERGAPALAIVVGRLHESGTRFVANAPPGRPDVLAWLVANDALGAPGRVTSREGRNEFLPDALAP